MEIEAAGEKGFRDGPHGGEDGPADLRLGVAAFGKQVWETEKKVYLEETKLRIYCK